MTETCTFCGEQTEFMHLYRNGWHCEEHKQLGRNFRFRDFADLPPLRSNTRGSYSIYRKRRLGKDSSGKYAFGVSIRRQPKK